jgi:hypothetical protein
VKSKLRLIQFGCLNLPGHRCWSVTGLEFSVWSAALAGVVAFLLSGVPFLTLGAGADFVLLTWSENDSPWNDTDKLLADVNNSFWAADTSPLALKSRELGRGVAIRLRSTDWDRFARVETDGIGVIVAVLETNGDGHRREFEAEEEVEVEEEEDEEEDM